MSAKYFNLKTQHVAQKSLLKATFGHFLDYYLHQHLKSSMIRFQSRLKHIMGKLEIPFDIQLQFQPLQV